MASNSETGHVVNISNWKLMIDKCVGFGTAYQPSNAALSIANMMVLWATADTAQGLLTTAIANSKGPINARQIIFDPSEKLVTRTVNHHASTGTSKQMKADSKGLADKFRGFGVKVNLLPDGTPDPNSVSTSHQGYVQKADTFKLLKDLYASDTFYDPNESELKVTALTTLYNAMKAANDAVGTIIAPVENARFARDHAIYDEGTGIYDVQALVKKYVKSVFGATSDEAKSVTGIKFTKPKD